MRKIMLIGILLVVGTLFMGCAHTPQGSIGERLGAAVGGVGGALIDHRHPVRGAIIGATAVGLAGGAIGDAIGIGERGQVVSEQPRSYSEPNRYPDRYRSERYYYEDPYRRPDPRRCRKVTERTWVNGRLVKEEVKMICD